MCPKLVWLKKIWSQNKNGFRFNVIWWTVYVLWLVGFICCSFVEERWVCDYSFVQNLVKLIWMKDDYDDFAMLTDYFITYKYVSVVMICEMYIIICWYVDYSYTPNKWWKCINTIFICWWYDNDKMNVDCACVISIM